MFDDRSSSGAVQSKPEDARGRDDGSRSTALAGVVVLALLVVAVVLGVRRREEPGLEPPF